VDDHNEVEICTGSFFVYAEMALMVRGADGADDADGTVVPLWIQMRITVPIHVPRQRVRCCWREDSVPCPRSALRRDN